jgi:Ca2+-binding RTX toxin-like protein
MLSAAVSYDANSGTLDINGSLDADQIEVYLIGDGTDVQPVDRDRAVVAVPLGTRVTVLAEGIEIYSNFFPTELLRNVNVFASAGDDHVLVSASGGRTNMNVFAEGGNDEIEAFNDNSATGANVWAGSGDDLIRLLSGRETSHGHVAYGELGNDVIFGSHLADMLYGDWDPAVAPLVQMFLAGGDDIIYAGAGDDAVYGGDGNDKLFGEEGDDYINGGLGEDLLDGGAGTDLCVSDQSDKVSEIELLMTVLQ